VTGRADRWIRRTTIGCVGLLAMIAGTVVVASIRAPGRVVGQRPEVRGPAVLGHAGRDTQVLAWRWALANRAGDGSLPSGRDIGRQHGRHERWGRLVKNAGLAGKLDTQT